MLAFVRANRLNIHHLRRAHAAHPASSPPASRTSTCVALDELGIDEVKCNALGLRLFKIACPWPISRRDLQEFADGLDLIIVVEERSLIGVQVREGSTAPPTSRPASARRTERGDWLFPVKGARDPNEVAICIGERLLNYVTDGI